MYPSFLLETFPSITKYLALGIALHTVYVVYLYLVLLSFVVVVLIGPSVGLSKVSIPYLLLHTLCNCHTNQVSCISGQLDSCHPRFLYIYCSTTSR